MNIINIIKAHIVKVIIFEAAKIVITGAIIKKITKLLTPAHNNIGIKGAQIITAVPKSGWFNTINADINVKRPGTNIIEGLLTCSWLLDRYFAITITQAHFKYSDGWI